MRTNESCLFCHLFLSVLLVLKGFCQGNEFFNDNKGPLLPESYKIGWMEAIDDHKLISGITIPGTHDTMALHGGPVAECQAWDLEDQLKAGVRYLDLRIVAIENKLYLVHWVIYQHKTFIEVLKTVKAFLSTFKSETVVIRVKPELFSQNSVEMLIREIINDDKVVWVNSNMPTMGKARGKVVFVQAPGFKVGVPLLETDNEGNYEVRHIADKEKMIEQHLTQASSQCGKERPREQNICGIIRQHHFRFSCPLPCSDVCNNMAAPIALHLEFGGGAELLFDGVKEHHVTLPDQSEPSLVHTLPWTAVELAADTPFWPACLLALAPSL
ncbi:hypothetical protein DPEC_G00333170 [Dallia pectoralis]|uniref:Uncharacterized protein n=1 Tax=Dallia pectoralis TaxID=75939 RepID=A0ACC2F6C9_DALPE|nr:hypothetical protein DPEC_G00333170 [Dallia pectoralis]